MQANYYHILLTPYIYIYIYACFIQQSEIANSLYYEINNNLQIKCSKQNNLQEFKLYNLVKQKYRRNGI